MIRKKNHKGRVRNIYKISQNFLNLDNKFAILAAESGRISKSEISAIILAIKRIIKERGKKDKNKAYLRIHPQINKTKKSLGVRMGKGKGSIYTQYTRIRPGTIIIEWKSSDINPYNIWSILNSKLSIRTFLITPLRLLR